LPDVSPVVRELCRDQPAPDWLAPKLERCAKFISGPRKDEDDLIAVDANLIASATYLRDWLQVYAIAAELAGEDVPEIIDDSFAHLDELIDFIRENRVLDINRGGPKVDRRKRICALVCLAAWEEIWGKGQPHSTGLWAACDALWRACGHLDGEVKWRHFLENRP
jgi:hypothetical protein